MVDRTTKLLLLAIAVGLWMNVASQWLRPVPVHAAVETAQDDLTMISADLIRIGNLVNSIWMGTCPNPKIC